MNDCYQGFPYLVIFTMTIKINLNTCGYEKITDSSFNYYCCIRLQ